MGATAAGGAFGLFGVPFAAFGLYFIFGRFIYKAARKRRTTYAVTDRRVISVVTGRRGESVEAVYLDSLANVSTSVEPDGSGTIEFGPRSRYANTGLEFFGRGQWGGGGGGLAFYDIGDPRGVADLIARLRAGRGD